VGSGKPRLLLRTRCATQDVNAMHKLALLCAANFSRKVDPAPGGKRIVTLMPAAESKGAQEAQNHA
jgi:hypothetical protein